MAGEIIRFVDFELDTAAYELRQSGRPVRLERKALDLLFLLAERRGHLVTRSEIIERVWGKGVFLDSDSSINTAIRKVRRALNDRARTPKFIVRIHGKGYRFGCGAELADRETGISVPRSTNALIDRDAGLPERLMVGREEELTGLRKCLTRASDGSRQIVFVTGEPGIGKTTFVRSFLGSLARNGTARIAHGQCVEQYGSGEPYMPVFEALTRLSREPDSDRLLEILRRVAPSWLAQMPSLFGEVDRQRLQVIHHVTQQRMLREMTEALDTLAAECPVVLLLEDLHWSDFSTLELISAIARRTEPARLLIVSTYRPSEIFTGDHRLRTMKDELELHQQCEELPLRLLSEDDVAVYLQRRFAGREPDLLRGVAPIIHHRTEGNPLFMVNVVDYLERHGSLHEPNKIGAPRTIARMIERNFERLDRDQQKVLEAASVAGAGFSSASVAAALKWEVGEVEARCEDLAHREQFISSRGALAWPDGTTAAGFRFQHALYQEVLYGLVSARYRVELHRRIAEREEAGYGTRKADVAAELAHHFSVANNINKAVEYLQLAGDHAAEQGAAVVAEDHYRRALALLRELPEGDDRDRRELALQIGLGAILRSVKSWSHPEAARALTRAEQLAERLEEFSRLVIVLKGLASSAVSRGCYNLGRELAQRMLLAADRSGDDASLSAAHTYFGQTLLWCAHLVDANKHLEIGGSYYNEAKSKLESWGVDAPANQAICVLLLGFPDRARGLMKQAFDRSKRQANPHGSGTTHMWGGAFSIQLCDARTTLAHAEALRRAAAIQPVWTGLADLYTGEALTIQCDWERAAAYARRAISFYKATGMISMVPVARLTEAKCFASQGLVSEALGLVSDAIESLEECTYRRSPVLRQRADLLAQSKADPSVIDVAYRAAIECARDQGAKFYELQATTHFARWLRSQRRAAEARTLLTQMYSWFTEGFDTPALTEARSLLEEPDVKPLPKRSSDRPPTA